MRRDDRSVQKKRIEEIAATVMPGCRVAFHATPVSWLRFSLEDALGRLVGPSDDYHVSEIADLTDEKISHLLIALASPRGRPRLSA